MILATLLSIAWIQDGQAQDTGDPPQWQAHVETSGTDVLEEQIVYRITGLAVLGPAGQEVRADRARLVLDRLRYEAAIGGAPGPLPPASTAPTEGLAGRWTVRLLEALGLPESEGLLLLLELDGSVLLTDLETTLLASELRYDARRGVTEFVDTDLRISPSFGPNGWPLRILADTLREDPDGSLHAAGVSVSTCDDEEPHYSVRMKELHGTPSGPDSWVWSPAGSWFSIGGLGIAPLPSFDFDTGESFSVFKGIHLFSDNSFGVGIGPTLGATHRLYDDEAALSWEFEPSYTTKRGFPLDARIGVDSEVWTADWQLFWLHDKAPDRNQLTQRVIREDDNRWRARLDNRFDLGDGWILDADLALTSDPIVDPEYFGEHWRYEDDAKTELYLRKGTEGGYFDASSTYRLDDAGFTPLGGFPAPGSAAPATLDELPRTRYDRYSETLFEVPAGFLGGADGKAPVNLSWGGEIARLQQRDRDLRVPPFNPRYARNASITRDRARVWAEIAVPVHVAGLFFRPGGRAQVLAYNQDLNGTGSAQRGLYEGFVEAGAVLVKDWEHGWRHHVLPQLRFRDLSTGGDPVSRVAALDRNDVASSGRVVELSLRQFYFAPGSTEPWVDLDVLVPFYPDSKKPLDDGIFPAPRATDPASSWGPAELRLIWTPAAYGKTLEGVQVETRWRQAFRPNRVDELFTRVSVQPHDRLSYGAALYKVDEQFSYGTLDFDWRFSDSWAVGGLLPYTFTGQPSRFFLVEFRHYAHDFVLTLNYTRSQEAGRSGVSFGIEPRFLVDPGPGALSRE